jgi:hypothetical protein
MECELVEVVPRRGFAFYYFLGQSGIHSPLSSTFDGWRGVSIRKVPPPFRRGCSGLVHRSIKEPSKGGRWGGVEEGGRVWEGRGGLALLFLSSFFPSLLPLFLSPLLLPSVVDSGHHVTLGMSSDSVLAVPDKDSPFGRGQKFKGGFAGWCNKKCLSAL